MPVVLAPCSTHVATGPFGPVIDAPADDTPAGIRARSGSPTLWPDHPQNVRGSGDSATNRVRLVVAPLPGNTIGVDGRPPGARPRITSSVAADRHVVVDGLVAVEHCPYDACVRFARRMPTAWNGPDIHRSMLPFAVVASTLETATLALLPA